jgi:ligand-binding sensor domain-containing protein
MELAGSEVVPHPGLAAQLEVKDREIFDVLKDRRGNTWYCTGKGVVRETNGRLEKVESQVPIGHAALNIHEDAQGTIWIAKDKGLFRATPAGLELVDKDMQVRSLYSDRDGNLWVGTNGDGLYRFKDPAVRMFTTADGLPEDLVMTVIVAHDGSIWTGANCGGITRFDGKRFQTYSEKDGLLNSCVWSIAEDQNRDLWIGTYGGGAFHYHDGNFTQYSKSQGMADNIVNYILAARDGAVWFGTPNGVTRLKDGQFRNFTTADGLSDDAIATIFEDRAGNIWAATRLGLNRLAGDRFENFASEPKGGVVIAFGQDRDGGFFVNAQTGAEAVTRRIYKDRIDTIKGLTAYDLIETEHGELWFGGTPISRIQPGNFTNARPHDEPLDYEAFSTADGLTTAGTTSLGGGLALTRDGKLYAATPKGLAMFDLSRLHVTNAKPSIYLTNVTIGRNT